MFTFTCSFIFSKPFHQQNQIHEIHSSDSRKIHCLVPKFIVCIKSPLEFTNYIVDI